MSKVEVDFSDNMRAYIDQRVASGEYADASDYLRGLVRADEAHLEWLRDEIAKGDASGFSPYTGREIVDRALERARQKCA